MADRQIPLPAVDFPEMRLGRHVNHDPESLRFLVAPPTARATPRSVKHERRVPVFQQGDLGSCTVNSLLGALGTDPFWDTLPTDLQRQLRSPNVQSELVQPLYREVTRLDPFRGYWEPDDTGSDGLTNGKVAVGRGWISGYLHATSLAACHEAIQKAPFITGVPWYNQMFYPSADGLVSIGGVMSGGHEIVCDEYDLNRDWWWFTNSWDTTWGRNGRFAMTSETFQSLLSQQGDATSFVPNTAPAPVPTPLPEIPVKPDFPLDQLDRWASRTARSWPKYQREAARVYTEWRNS